MARFYIASLHDRYDPNRSVAKSARPFHVRVVTKERGNFKQSVSSELCYPKEEKKIPRFVYENGVAEFLNRSIPRL
jgi:hypothetical protein